MCNGLITCGWPYCHMLETMIRWGVSEGFRRWTWGGSLMSDSEMVTLNCGECGAWPAGKVSPEVVDGVVACSVCGAGIDVGHAFRHARWCRVCGVEVCDCECGEVV